MNPLERMRLEAEVGEYTLKRLLNTDESSTASGEEVLATANFFLRMFMSIVLQIRANGDFDLMLMHKNALENINAAFYGHDHGEFIDIIKDHIRQMKGE